MTLRSPRRFPPYDRIIDLVAERFRLTREAILGADRHREIVLARHVAMYLCYRYCKNASYPTIGSTFSHRDHTTVRTAVLNIQSRLSKEPSLSVQVDAVRAAITREVFYSENVRA